MTYLLGIDVGSGSARCGVFDTDARLLGVGVNPIAQHHAAPDFVEQASDDIWNAICMAVKQALADAGVDGADVAALSYSATCSLVLRNLGGAISVEMEIPKLMWVKRHRPDLWARLGHAGDLADFLCLKSTRTLARSICTLACKWTYDPEAGGWNHGFLNQVGLDDLLDKAALPVRTMAIGTNVGTLTEAAAADLGLSTSCKVGMSLIDAHAGALGTSGLAETGIEHRLALIAGTSNSGAAMAMAA